MSKDAFAQGKLAFEHNLPMSSCDYPVGSSLRADWMAGWTEANNLSRKPSAASQTHVGMMGDGTEEQNLNQAGNPAARITESEVRDAFSKH